MASTKYLAKGNIGETRFVLAQFERTAHHEGKAEQQGPEAAAHIATAVRKQQGMNPEAQVACSFLFSAGLQPKVGGGSHKHPGWFSPAQSVFLETLSWTREEVC